MLEDILLQHFAQYPKMEPQDAVKLIYQQEFGPEHMIQDAAKSLAALKMEIAQLQSGGAKEPLYEYQIPHHPRYPWTEILENPHGEIL